MKRQAVDSSAVLSVGYDENEQTLEVEFSGGRVYQYFPVEAGTYAELQQAGSVGKFINTEIKPKYDYEEVLPEKEKEG